MTAIERVIDYLRAAGNHAVAEAARIELTALRDDLEGLRNRVVMLEAERDGLVKAGGNMLQLMNSLKGLGYFTNEVWTARIQDMRFAIDAATKTP